MANVKKKSKKIVEEDFPVWEDTVEDTVEEEVVEQVKEEVVIENTKEIKHVGDGKRYSPPKVYFCVNCKKNLKAEDFYNGNCY